MFETRYDITVECSGFFIFFFFWQRTGTEKSNIIKKIKGKYEDYFSNYAKMNNKKYKKTDRPTAKLKEL